MYNVYSHKKNLIWIRKAEMKIADEKRHLTQNSNTNRANKLKTLSWEINWEDIQKASINNTRWNAFKQMLIKQSQWITCTSFKQWYNETNARCSIKNTHLLKSSILSRSLVLLGQLGSSDLWDLPPPYSFCDIRGVIYCVIYLPFD